MKNKMNFSLILMLLLFFSGCSNDEEKLPSPDEEGEYLTLRILTYNIYHGEATNGEIDMDLFAEIINNESPDLVALQEVDKGVLRSNKLDITAELSERTGLDGYFFKYRDYGGGEFGAAILSRFPVIDIDELEGDTQSGRPPKVFPFVKVMVDKDTHIYFNSSHLSTTLEEAGAQARQLAEYYNNKLNKAPLLISGDLNLVPSSKEMKVLLDDFAISDNKLSYTISTRGVLRKKIDYVLYPDNDNWKVLEAKPICRTDASDHCAVLSVLRYKKPRKITSS